MATKHSRRATTIRVRVARRSATLARAEPSLPADHRTRPEIIPDVSPCGVRCRDARKPVSSAQGQCLSIRNTLRTESPQVSPLFRQPENVIRPPLSSNAKPPFLRLHSVCQTCPHEASRNDNAPMDGALGSASQQEFGGATQSRTGLDGFAIRCITDLLSRRCG